VDYLSDSDAILQVESSHCILNRSPFDVIGEVIWPVELLGKVLFVIGKSCVFSHITREVSHYCLISES